MTATAIHWPVLDRLMVTACRRLGRGRRLAFQVGGVRGQLLLEPGLAPGSGVELSVESGCGVLTLCDASVLLSLFGECPVVLSDTGNDPHSWFWALFEQQLSPQLAALFGYLRPLADVQLGAFECRISVVLGASRGIGRLCLAPECLLALFDAGSWQAVQSPFPERLPVSVAVVLGTLHLSVRQVRTVQVGDVLVPETLHFCAEGFGLLSVGRLRLRVQIDDERGRRCLCIDSIEEVAVEDAFNTNAEVGDVDELQGRFEGDEPLEQLPLTFSVRCGALKLSLGELRQLVPGVVLDVVGYDVGMAGLYYGDRAVGHGQLVEVDGRLGLQLSRICFSQ